MLAAQQRGFLDRALACISPEHGDFSSSVGHGRSREHRRRLFNPRESRNTEISWARIGPFGKYVRMGCLDEGRPNINEWIFCLWPTAILQRVR